MVRHEGMMYEHEFGILAGGICIGISMGWDGMSGW